MPEISVAEFYAESAIRHFDDATLLSRENRQDAAGHLIGFAVECAIKHVVQALRPSTGMPHVHLPALIENARKVLHGRQKQSIQTVLARPGFMGGWAVEQRYGPNGFVSKTQFETWRDDAKRVIGAAGLRRHPK
jgi:hypothetical protein